MTYRKEEIIAGKDRCMMSGEARNNKVVFERMLLVVFSVCAFVSMAYLFWAQSVKLNGLYYSDFMGHINRAIQNGGSGYSLEGKLVVLMNALIGKSTIAISVILAVMVIFTPAAVAYMLCQIDQSNGRDGLRKEQRYEIGLWSIFTGPLVIPFVWNWFYKNTMNINAWHNSTSMEMRLFSVLALALYFRIQHYYLDQEKEIKPLDWLLLSLSLFISTWFKPSFFVGFAPVMLSWLAIDFVKHIKEGKTVRKIITLGFAAIPAGCMAILQYMKLYGFKEDVSLMINETQNVGLYITRLSLFALVPLLVYLYNREKIRDEYRNGNRSYYQVALLWAVEILYHFSLMEVGRKGGNLGWGARIGNYFLTVISLRLFCINIKNIWREKAAGAVVRIYDKFYLCTVGFLITWQLGCGLYYYYILMTGGNYMI